MALTKAKLLEFLASAKELGAETVKISNTEFGDVDITFRNEESEKGWARFIESKTKKDSAGLRPRSSAQAEE